MEKIDRKFRFVAVNPCNDKVYTEDTAIVFCAKDAAVPGMLIAYREECKALGCDDNHLHSIELMWDRVKKFQNTERKIPDTNTDCELDRCIGGLNLNEGDSV